MRILALDTSTPMGSVAVLDGGVLLSEVNVRLPAKHSEFLLLLVEQALSLASLPLESIDEFIVGVGPGSFTSVRIGMATARGLSLSTNKPLRGVLSLDALAASAASIGPFLVALDAYRGEFFCAVYQNHGTSRTALLSPCCASPETIAKELDKLDLAALPAIGNLTDTQWNALNQSRIRVVSCPASRGTPLARLVALEALQGRALTDHDHFEPIYLRAPDAKLPGT